MDVHYPGFGMVVVDGVTYDHDVVIEHGRVRARDKGPSRLLKGRSGHTPLSAEEAIPWSNSRLIIGSGYSGRLPVLPGVQEAAAAHEVTLEIVPTADACALLKMLSTDQANAILHVTC